MEPKSGAARNEKKDGEPQAPATALKKAEEQVVVGGEGGGMEDVAVVSVEEEEEAALLATGIQNDVSGYLLEKKDYGRFVPGGLR